METRGDAMAALEQYRAAPFDVVIVDVRMPRLSGISFLKNLRRTAASMPRRVAVGHGRSEAAAGNAGFGRVSVEAGIGEVDYRGGLWFGVTGLAVSASDN